MEYIISALWLALECVAFFLFASAFLPYRTDGEASSNGLNALIRETVNPHTEKIPEFAFGERIFRLHDRVMQTKNNYNLEGYDSACKQKFKGVFNGDIGSICKIHPDKLCVDFDGRIVEYSKTQLGDLELAYAITIHKSMGSEYETVIIPILMAHRILLTKNLIYTAVTRAKKRVILVGQKRALFLAITPAERSNGTPALPNGS